MFRTLAWLALSLLMVSTAPAGADTAPAPGDSPEQVARALEESPVYVSPALRDALSTEEARLLGERIDASDTNIFVVVMPWRVEPRSKVDVLANRVGQEGYYLAVGGDGRIVTGTQIGMDPERVERRSVAELAADVVNGTPDSADSSLAERLETAVELLEEDGAAVGAHRRLREGPWHEQPRARWGAGIGATLVLVCLVLFGVRWWSRRPIRVAPLTEAVHRTVDSAQREAERARQAERLTSYGRRVAGRQDDSERVRVALEAYEAAAKVLDTVDDMSDLVGVKVLLDRCAAALEGRVSPGHCFFDPRHTEGTAQVRWRASASFNSIRVLACRTCRRAVREHRVPESVVDCSGPRPVPYYAVPAERSVWAATGYGTLVPDLAARVLRGELRG